MIPTQVFPEPQSIGIVILNVEIALPDITPPKRSETRFDQRPCDPFAAMSLHDREVAENPSPTVMAA